MDQRFKQSGLSGPLHCIPMIVKDNFETIGLQSANGSLALAGFVSDKDAFQVKKIKDAGAIVIAKSNMAEWAFTPNETLSSILPGYTKNPYALDRVTAGSSGGTAASVAASFGAVGLGSDTGNSIRGPSSHQALVGIRSTMGLTSRAGVMPLNLLADIAGPMARTVEDAVTVFQAIVGSDPADPVTAAAAAHLPQTYAASLVRDGLKGARIGVLRFAYERDSTDPEIVQVFMRAVEDLKFAGATIIDPGVVEGIADIRRPQGSGPCMGFKYDINRYLAGHGDKIPMKSLAEIVKSRRFHPTVAQRLEQAEAGVVNGPETDACKAEMAYREQVRAAVNKAMDAQKIDAWVYPTWSNPPRLIGDLNTPGGDNSQFFSPTTGFPVDPGADGLHARRTLAGGHHVLRPRLVGAGADQIRLRLRAGDASSASARKHTAAALNPQDLVEPVEPSKLRTESTKEDHGNHRHPHVVLHVRTGEAARDAARRVRLQARRCGRRLADLRLPPSEIGVHPAEGPTYESGMRHQITFMCDDINKTIAELRAKGVTIDGRAEGRRLRHHDDAAPAGRLRRDAVRAAPRDRGDIAKPGVPSKNREEASAKKARRAARRLGAAGRRAKTADRRR